MADKVIEILVEALKQAMAQPGEQRLFKSGKLAGLFAGRTGANGEAAARALAEGLVELVRTETRGKTSVDWVRPTPKGVHFVHEHESPARALEELQAVLRTNQDGLPTWLEEMRREIQGISSRLADEAQRWTHRLESLSARVEEALRRAEASAVRQSNGQADEVPWALDALVYLDRRRAGGAPELCPLPELFAALRLHHADLSVAAFHDGLRRLRDHRALDLVAFPGAADALAEPEYALLDGPTVLYYATR
jgi:hypothetical protein